MRSKTMLSDTDVMVSKEPTILLENNEVVVINKPTGLIVHADGREKTRSVADWFITYCPEAKGIGEPATLKDGTVVQRHGIVHRLDRDTSGVLVLAKTEVSFKNLKQQFQDRIIEKTYRAFVYGVLKETEGVIERSIGKSSKDFRLWSAQRGARGELREAITEYRVLKDNGAYTYVEVKPKTGRTHQIRVHFKAIHHPIVADPLYAPNQALGLGFLRLALHAQHIAFNVLSGKRCQVAAPLPDDFIRAEQAIEG